MKTLMGFINDLEQAFRLDCSSDDIKNNKEAKKCYKVIRKIRKKTDGFYGFLNKQNVLGEKPLKKEKAEESIEVIEKKVKKWFICSLIGFVGMAVCGIICGVLLWTNPDMTAARLFLEYPEVHIIGLVFGAILYFFVHLIQRALK